jgi:ABC-2 type transport system ATP-binding protein
VAAGADRVVIMNTSVRTIGRPEDLWAALFAASLDGAVVGVLPEPGRVFGGSPAMQGWRMPARRAAARLVMC